MLPEEMAAAEEIRAQFDELKELADEGNDAAAKVIAWFDQVSGQASIAGCYPQDLGDGIVLMHDAAHTTELFWGSRLLRWQIDNPGKIPTHYSFTIDVEFASLT